MTKVNTMKTPYKILKLRSGEELIARICGESKGKLILERPMIFKTVLLSSPSGKQREITVLKNWLSLSNAIETKIPKDFIATFLEPDSGVIELYNLEKEKEDIDPPTKRKIIEGRDISKKSKKKKFTLPDPPNNISDLVNELSEENLQNLFDLIREDIKNMKENSQFMDEDSDFPYPPMGEAQNWISMSMFFPPEALMSLVESGLLDIEDVQRLIDTMSENPSNYRGNDEKRKSSEDFGNDWTDWSPDLRDY